MAIETLWNFNLFEILNQTVSFVLFGTRYKFVLWQFSVLVGFGTFLISRLLNRRVPRILFWSLGSLFPRILITAPIIEEVIFRLILITFLFSITNSVIIAIFVSAFLWGVSHIIYGSHRVLDTFLHGLLLGLIFVNFGIVATIIIHMTHNFLDILTGG
ncbi:TPA: CPBP family intramembrane metalloprotease [archaeon]|uniref:CPBP family intramembrane metalloprotease n=1 Tax=Candidatus Naiadarchaeum limnaeum TaxID=2756139 RepID=A0A832XM26_9ARCH|nr:CPBP family intramembrane metalloprotease [Candidatus Naiadarchaeales archaeon SRR2090153.bin1042]HIK00653.1 CPBP family intramembrane metalloprotease [Candidatus Naiadarchaeum limnaeum]